MPALLVDLAAVGVQVVVVAEAQAEIGTGKFSWERWKRVRSGDTAKGRTVHRSVARGTNNFQAGDASIFQDEELQHYPALLPLGRFRDQGVPLLFDVLQNAGKIGIEVDP